MLNYSVAELRFHTLLVQKCFCHTLSKWRTAGITCAYKANFIRVEFVHIILKVLGIFTPPLLYVIIILVFIVVRVFPYDFTILFSLFLPICHPLHHAHLYTEKCTPCFLPIASAACNATFFVG